MNAGVHNGATRRRRRDAAAGIVGRYWYPLMALVRRDLKRRYATTMVGFAWTALQPLVLMAVYVLVFGFILGAGRTADGSQTFAFFMLSGMLPYLATAEGIQRSSTALREDAALLDRQAFPAEVVPAARVVAAAVGESVALALFVIIGGAFFGVPVSAWLLTLPVLVVLRVVITCGLAWMVSILTIFVTDLAEVLSLLLTAWLFLTPIFYSADAVPEAVRWILVVNPLHPLVEAYRSVLLQGQAPVPDGLLVTVWATLLAGVGLWFFRKALDRAKDFL